MKKITILFCLALLLSLNSVVAQGLMTQDQLTKMSQAQKDLYQRVKTADSLKTVRIGNYLQQNPQAEERFVYDDKMYILTDVIENNPIYTTLDNLDSARASYTNELQVGGTLGLDLDGTGIAVGVWDGGPIQTTHTEFQDASGSQARVSNIEFLNTDGSTAISSHGTHVSGTIAARGVNANAKGMATNVALRTYNFNNDTPEMVIEATNPSAPLILSNHSYGVSVAQGNGILPTWIMGAYGDSAREIDDIARVNPKYLMVASAGNSGNTQYVGGLFGGYDKLTTDKTAKNNLVVANANSSVDVFTSQVSFPISSSSSQGPTDDLRIKPDIAGDGTSVFSTFPNDAYGSISGTSMAAPHVTGTIVLLQQYFNQLNGDFANSATMKALVCHTASDDPIFVGPDPIYGWGFLNARDAANTLTRDANGTAVVEELTLNDGGTYTLTFNADDRANVSATICWTDLPGVPVSGDAALNDPTPRLINDLDIRITKDGTTFLPWKLDFSAASGFSAIRGDNFVDNIERIDIDTPTAGTYTLTVTHKGQLQGDDPFSPRAQDFSLVVTGSAVSLSANEAVFDNFALWPNPADSVLNINFKSNDSEDIKMVLFNIDGRKVLEKQVSPMTTLITEQLDVANLDSGLYILNLTQGNKTESKKVIIE
ncbi:S8 family serine peptidase [Winogradskyella aurantia]|uniref:Ig-like domain-containing protein n=1 Tax=Winogradskyella aurantia TaxID=1915063 RepID=A0A265UP99_9FLAO|nr:S8 family serine peptidase [Winogradskyella aurantia]OZV67110.1 hypothetical protein CA834_12350 [Winogradskyella aurantia]